jgi:hypothetical protein
MFKQIFSGVFGVLLLGILWFTRPELTVKIGLIGILIVNILYLVVSSLGTSGKNSNGFKKSNRNRKLNRQSTFAFVEGDSLYKKEKSLGFFRGLFFVQQVNLIVNISVLFKKITYFILAFLGNLRLQLLIFSYLLVLVFI